MRIKTKVQDADDQNILIGANYKIEGHKGTYFTMAVPNGIEVRKLNGSGWDVFALHEIKHKMHLDSECPNIYYSTTHCILSELADTLEEGKDEHPNMCPEDDIVFANEKANAVSRLREAAMWLERCNVEL